MRMLDRPLIEQHLQNMEQALGNLARYRSLGFEDFEKDLSLIWVSERGLQILIQNLLDIGAHILASELRTIWRRSGRPAPSPETAPESEWQRKQAGAQQPHRSRYGCRGGDEIVAWASVAIPSGHVALIVDSADAVEPPAAGPRKAEFSVFIDETAGFETPGLDQGLQTEGGEGFQRTYAARSE